eukprot:15147396-Ditylum_brightwellii.AAC.1
MKHMTMTDRLKIIMVKKDDGLYDHAELYDNDEMYDNDEIYYTDNRVATQLHFPLCNDRVKS